MLGASDARTRDSEGSNSDYDHTSICLDGYGYYPYPKLAQVSNIVGQQTGERHPHLSLITWDDPGYEAMTCPGVCIHYSNVRIHLHLRLHLQLRMRIRMYVCTYACAPTDQE
jgi:hypothetical protein